MAYTVKKIDKLQIHLIFLVSLNNLSWNDLNIQADSTWFKSETFLEHILHNIQRCRASKIETAPEGPSQHKMVRHSKHLKEIIKRVY